MFKLVLIKEADTAKDLATKEIPKRAKAGRMNFAAYSTFMAAPTKKKRKISAITQVLVALVAILVALSLSLILTTRHIEIMAKSDENKNQLETNSSNATSPKERPKIIRNFKVLFIFASAFLKTKTGRSRINCRKLCSKSSKNTAKTRY